MVFEIETIIKIAKDFPHPTEEYPLHHIDSPQRIKKYIKRGRRDRGLYSIGMVGTFNSATPGPMNILYFKNFSYFGDIVIIIFNFGRLTIRIFLNIKLNYKKFP